MRVFILSSISRHPTHHRTSLFASSPDRLSARAARVVSPNQALLHLITAMITWMNPQQYQQYFLAAAAPTGWKGSWPPSAPSGPPPPPQNMKVDPKTWFQGQWQFNPAFRTAPSAQPQAWAPHPVWQQQAADYNPYKRKPNPGDAAYWATQLSDNPLGLHNMHIKYVLSSCSSFDRTRHNQRSDSLLTFLHLVNVGARIPRRKSSKR